MFSTVCLTSMLLTIVVTAAISCRRRSHILHLPQEAAAAVRVG